MRRSHFETLRPICPRCKQQGRTEVELALAEVLDESEGFVDTGIIHCTSDACRQEYPIIDGIPIIVPDIRAYLTNCQNQILWRDDLPESIGSLVGDALGPGTDYDQTRQHLSIYCWGHYADLNSNEEDTSGTLCELLDSCIEPLESMQPPAIDLGCSVGRGTIELAKNIQGLTLGTDLNFAMLRKAHQVLRNRTLTYDRRRIGIVYDRRSIPADFEFAEFVDYWACDATALPFRDGSFGALTALNLVDCVSSPLDLLESIAAVLMTNGRATLTTPYDWAPSATSVEAWIGGHSQRGQWQGAAEPLMRSLLTPGAHPQSTAGLDVVSESDHHRWVTRMHDRSHVAYDVHAFSVKRV